MEHNNLAIKWQVTSAQIKTINNNKNSRIVSQPRFFPTCAPLLCNTHNFAPLSYNHDFLARLTVFNRSYYVTLQTLLHNNQIKLPPIM